jgi:hypothetical protein
VSRKIPPPRCGDGKGDDQSHATLVRSIPEAEVEADLFAEQAATRGKAVARRGRGRPSPISWRACSSARSRRTSAAAARTSWFRAWSAANATVASPRSACTAAKASAVLWDAMATRSPAARICARSAWA